MDLTADNLRTFLSAHLHQEITGIVPVGLGEWSKAFYFTANGQQKVIRFSAFDADFRQDRFAARFSSPRLHIPPVEEIGQAFGLYFAITPRIAGKMIDHLTAEEMRRAVPALLELLNALREVDGSQTHGYGGFDGEGNAPFPGWRAYLSAMTEDTPGSRLSGWKENLARNRPANELYQVGRQRLSELIARCPEERHLIHNDLLHFNLLIHNNQVAGLIDWGCGMWGDFLYDLAMITAWQFYYPAMAGIDFAGEAQRFYANKGVALPNFHERLQCYMLHQLLDTLAYNAWKQNADNLALTTRRLREVLTR